MLRDQFPHLQILATTTEGANRPTPDHIRYAYHGTIGSAHGKQRIWMPPGCKPNGKMQACSGIRRRYRPPSLGKLVMNCAIKLSRHCWIAVTVSCATTKPVGHAPDRQGSHGIDAFCGISANEELAGKGTCCSGTHWRQYFLNATRPTRRANQRNCLKINGAFVAAMAARAQANRQNSKPVADRSSATMPATHPSACWLSAQPVTALISSN